jgi:hypothetical protein
MLVQQKRSTARLNLHAMLVQQKRSTARLNLHAMLAQHKSSTARLNIQECWPSIKAVQPTTTFRNAGPA